MTRLLIVVVVAVGLAAREVELWQLVLAAGAGLAVYAVVASPWPYRRCSRCEGSGSRSHFGGAYMRTCPTCRGTGRRRRLLSRLLG